MLTVERTLALFELAVLSHRLVGTPAAASVAVVACEAAACIAYADAAVAGSAAPAWPQGLVETMRCSLVAVRTERRREKCSRECLRAELVETMIAMEREAAQPSGGPAHIGMSEAAGTASVM